MRIGFDMLAVQSPHHGHRGIGRYSRHLVEALLARGDGHEYILYAHDGLPDDRIPASPRAAVRRLGDEPEMGLTDVSRRLDYLARANPDALDVLLILSPFEHWEHYHPPARPSNGLKLAAVVYDMIPFLFQREADHDPALMRSYRALDRLRHYDVLLAISAATRDDTRALLKLPAAQVVNIGGASDGGFFAPGGSEAATPDALQGLGIVRPFVLNVGGFDWRKNPHGLIDAFARLPEDLRAAHQLVLTFTILPEDLEDLRRHAREAGVDEALVVTGEVSDATLLTLYRRCAAFAFPSYYEGFGLPLLEAMHCGAAVVAGNNSSQPEVVGDAGLLANAGDPADIAAKLARILSEPDLARSLRERATVQAARFTWERTAALTAEALGRLPARRPGARVRTDPGHARKPRIAFFSPFPPRKSGISDYSALLLDELKRTYTIDLYHDRSYVPDLCLASDEFACHDFRLFETLAKPKDYHAIVYQMGNSRYHHFMYETMIRHPGVVTLHDYCLAAFHLEYGLRHRLGTRFLHHELLTWHPEDAGAIDALLKAGSPDRHAVAEECARRGWHVNARIIDAARKVVVHAPWCREQVRATRPEHAARLAVIPHGIRPRRLSADDRAAVRARFDIPRDALMVACFGFVHPDKMTPEALGAFRSLADADPSALFVLVGEEADGGVTRRHAESLGLGDRARFLGRRTIADFVDLAASTDIGVNLRRPPTNGETSGALLYLLAGGVATLVTDVATFADYPDHVVRKVRWESDGPAGLEAALHALAADGRARAALGRAAHEHVRAYHEWPTVARQYVDVIESCHEEQAAGRDRLRRRPLGLGRAGDAAGASSGPGHSPTEQVSP